jgi:hypothetical protein
MPPEQLHFSAIKSPKKNLLLTWGPTLVRSFLKTLQKTANIRAAALQISKNSPF